MSASGERWKDIAVTFRYDKSPLSRWLRQTAVQKRRGTIYILILAILTINFALVIPTVKNKAGPVVMTLLCLCLIGYVALKTRSKKGVQTLEELYQGGEEYRLFLRGDSMTYRCAGRETTVSYDDVRIREYEDHITYYTHEAKVFILPRAVLSDEQNEQLSAFYSRTLGKRHKICVR